MSGQGSGPTDPKAGGPTPLTVRDPLAPQRPRLPSSLFARLAAEVPPGSRPHCGGRWRLRNWRLRTRLVAVLLLPVLLALALGGIRVTSSLTEAEEFRLLQRQVEIGQQVAVVIDVLQRERELMAGYVADRRDGDRAALEGQLREVDAQVDTLRDRAGDLERIDGRVAADYRWSLDRLAGLPGLRETALTGALPAAAVVATYTELLDDLLELNQSLNRATTDQDMAFAAVSIDLLGGAKEQLAQQHALLLVGSTRGSLTPAELDALRSADIGFDAAVEAFLDGASAADRQLYLDTVAGAPVDARQRIVNTALAAADAEESLEVAPAAWEGAAGATAGLIRQVESRLLERLRSDTEELRTAARTAAVRDAAIVAGLVLVALALMLVVARSLMRPMGVLRAAAFDVADRRLPEVIGRIRETGAQAAAASVQPVAVHTREEVGQLARAFDAVHSEAVRLAAEQALVRHGASDVFVAMARRLQRLAERQLRLIDRLENGARNGDQQGDLRQLEHLATRMRRNSESLLVLAGQQVPRPPQGPVAVSDALRAAVAEVEQYRRIVLAPTPAVSVAGKVANDLVHLVAELLDNATEHSDERSTVMVSAELTDDGGLTFEIADNGVGMTAEELAQANDRLLAPPEVDLAVTRRMGLFVVGRLAARHEWAVRLRHNEPEPGLTAVLTIPARDLTRRPAPVPAKAAPAVPADGARAEPPVVRAEPAEVPAQVKVVDSEVPGPDPVTPVSLAGLEANTPTASAADRWWDLFDQRSSPVPSPTGAGSATVGLHRREPHSDAVPGRLATDQQGVGHGRHAWEPPDDADGR